MKMRTKALGRGFHVFVMAVTVFNLSFYGVFVAPKTVEAAADTTSATVDGSSNTVVAPGASITVAMNVHTYGSGSDDNWHSSRYLIEGGSWHCVNTPDHNSDGNYTESFTITAPNTPGTYDLSVRAYNGDNCSSGGGSTKVLHNAITVQSNPAKIVATKIVCDDESLLPNWGDNTPNVNITADTAADFVKNNEGHCWFAEGWNFQWSKDYNTYNPGDNAGEINDAVWHTFGPTDGSGVATVEINNPNTSKLWLREVMQDGYIHFSGDTSAAGGWDDVSAEFYCHTDVINYDNWDWIAEPSNNHTYYCVAWNVAERQPTYGFEGYKWNDLDGNGQWSDEPGLEGWTIKLYQDEQEIGSTVTNENGWYSFGDLPAGEYTVCEVQQTGWAQTYPVDPNCHTVDLPVEGEQSYNFGNHQQTVTLSVTKIVCTLESELPNWGDHKTDALTNPAMIDADTAQNWIDTHKSCSLQPGWSFQWAPGGTEKPTIWNSDGGDNAGELGAPWTTFGVTDGYGNTSTVVPMGDYTHIWVREVFQDGYLPFTNNATMQEDGSDYSAEIYCGWDIRNYDNYDYADMQTSDVTRYCVAWNTPENQRTGAIHGQKFNDLNGNGIWDCEIPEDFNPQIESVVPIQGCEPTMSGWTMFLDTNNNGVWDDGEPQSTTVENGWYWFDSLLPGTYNVCEVQQDGWNQTYPTNENYNCHTITVPFSQEGDTCLNPLTKELDIQQNEVLGPTCNFGNQQDYSITVYKDVVPARGESFSPEDWTWSLDAENGIANSDSRYLNYDTHTITENPDQYPAEQYDATWTCWIGENDVLASGVGRSFSTDEFSYQPWNGSHVWCQFVNTEKTSFSVSLTKEVDKSIVAPGENLTYTLNWSVTGDEPAVDIVVTDTVPTNTTFVSADNSGSESGGIITWDLGTQYPDASGSVSFVVTVSPNAENGTQIENQATITGTSTEAEVGLLNKIWSFIVPTAYAAVGDTHTVNSNLVVTTVVVPQVAGDETTPTLTITKTVDVDFANPGEKPQYTIVVKNTGDGAALNTVVTDTLPDGFTFGDGQTTKTWNLGDIVAGDSKTIGYTAVIGANVVAGNYVNVAEAKADNHDPVQTSATLEVRSPAVLGALVDAGIATRDIALLVNGLILILVGAWLVWRNKQQAKA